MDDVSPIRDRDNSVALRSPDRVMRLARLGSFHASRLSFLRVLLRRVKQQGWRVARPVWEIGATGVGHAVYSIETPDHRYNLVCFAHDLPDEARSDRVIAEAWDATFALVDGPVDDALLAELEANVPKQEAGRLSDKVLVLSRANRSVRLFNHVRERLAAGAQPDEEEMAKVGYLMRTTAVYGAGKFGAADLGHWAGRADFKGSFQPEMLTVWMIRTFTVDLVEHLAVCDGGAGAVRLSPDLRRGLGVGNSTGLGMAPFLVNHPLLLNAWIEARETALARIRRACDSEALSRLPALIDAALDNALGWECADPRQSAKIADLRRDLATLREAWDAVVAGEDRPFDTLVRWSDTALSIEGQEALVSMLIDAHPSLVDDLPATMLADERARFRIDGRRSVGSVLQAVEQIYPWALECDFADPARNARVWYTSQAKLEPRLGDRDGVLDAYEQPLAIGRDICAFHADLRRASIDDGLGSFLMRHPEHRHVARRLQQAEAAPYAEIRDNLIDADLVPIDMLRCKLSFFGATRFDPRSNLWLRITLFSGQPYPDDIPNFDPDAPV